MHARYRIDTAIGKGGMGIIYRAYDRLTETWVALKQLALELEEAPVTNALNGDSASLRLALAEEFRLLATLRHPHIVSVLDYGFVQQTAFYTMEFLAKSTTLVQAARGQALNAQLQLLGQLLQTLEYLRRHQVVHRDLKPDNVLVHAGQVKVLDFGLAVLEGQYSTSMGSVFYMAPEAFTDTPLAHAADLFAVGVMAYEILAGRRPFQAATLDQLVKQICTVEPDYTRLPGPPALHQVLARLLAKDPAARFATAAEALAALAAATDEVALPLETHATRRSFMQAAQFVGRAAELAQLNAALMQALAGYGSAWLLGGESGVGKSRLLEELRTQALVRRAWVWQGQALSEAGQPAQLWQNILRWLALVAEPTPAEASLLKPFVPQLENILGRPIPLAPALEAKAAHARFCALVLTLLRRAAAQQPILLILEDIHWAGPLSRSVLAWVMRAVSDCPVLVVGTYRADEQFDLPTQLPPANHLLLKRLTADQVADLTSAILGLPPDTIRPLVNYLYQETEGNALFVVEVLRSLAEEAGLLSQVQHMTLPHHLLVGGIQQVMQRRLQRLGSADYRWLELAAVNGRQLDLPLLQHLAGDFAWPQWLSRCAEAAILEPLGAAWRFAHDQLRQSVLEALPAAQQRAWHLAIAEGIEQAYTATLSEHLDRLAYHYLQTDRVDKQQHYLRLAGQAAQAAHDYEKALNYFGRLQGLETEAFAQLDLELRRGEVLEVLGRWPEAEAAFQAAREQATTCQDHLALARTQKALGSLARARGHYAAAIAWLAQAQQNAEATQTTPPVLAQIHAEKGCAHMYHNEPEAAQQHLETGLALARAQNDAVATALALNYLGNLYSRQKKYALAHTCLMESMVLRRKLGDKLGLAMTLNTFGMLHLAQGDHATAQALCAESLALRREIGHKPGIALMLSNLGEIACLSHDYIIAQSRLLESETLWREVGDQLGLGYALHMLGAVIYWQGADYRAAFKHHTESLSLGQAVQKKHLIVINLIGIAAVYAATGQNARAVQLAAAATHLQQLFQVAFQEIEEQQYERILRHGRATLPEAEFAAAWAAGLALTPEATLEYAVADLAQLAPA